MVKKKVDSRVKGLIEHNVKKNHRTLFVLVGDHGKDQVENLHKILSRTRVKARPSILWCYKKELGFSSHKKKRIKEIKRNQSRGLHDPDRDDPFDLFISSTNIRWTYYKETDKILGQTFGMCVLQDFEALTPNLLARTIETVEGGGIIVILLKTVKSLKQLYTLSMDVHARFRTEAHHEIVPRFNERFILSLGDCQSCLVLDDELNILPISSNVEGIPTSEGFLAGGLQEGDADASGFVEDSELTNLKASLADTPNIGVLISLTKTLDQAQAVMSFLDAISEKTLRSTVALTAARGRGKSASIGLCLAGAISYGYANIFVTAPSPENLKTVFEFVISGLKILKYSEHLDFEVLQEHHGDAGKVVVRINVFREHRQTIQYILPSDHAKLAQAELVAIDEAAAIPLPTVKRLMGPYVVFLSSTVNGYEGTGRALSLKLIQQLRNQQGAARVQSAKQAGEAVAGSKTKKGERQVHEERWKVAAERAAAAAASDLSSNDARSLTELTLDTPIRYASQDPTEKWLNNLLCLDVASHSSRIVSVMPAPKDCELYMVNRNALFSYHALSEAILQRIWALYTAAHYKNSPNDLQMLSDAPAHRLFVLLGPVSSSPSSSQIPDVLCVIQIAFEGYISQQSVQSEIMRGNKASGDMIPWTVSQQFNDNNFASLSGARIVRIATHPDVQKMGYGSRAIDLLTSYFQGELSAGAGPIPALGSFGGEGADDSDRHNCEEEEEEGEEEDIGEELRCERIKPRKKLPPLLAALVDRPAERLHWLGVSFGLTAPLLGFWSRKGFKTVYVRQTSNALTGEYSTILLRELNCDGVADSPSPMWLEAYVADYQQRLVSLLSFSFRGLDAALALTLVDPDRRLTAAVLSTPAAILSTPSLSDDADSSVSQTVSKQQDQRHSMLSNRGRLTGQELLSVHFTHHDMKRLEMYARNMVDHHMILDCVPVLARLLFLNRIQDLRFSYLQVAILLAIGLQHRDVDSIASELDVPASQVLAFFNKTVRKISSHFRELLESEVSKQMPARSAISQAQETVKRMEPLVESLVSGQAKDALGFGGVKAGTGIKGLHSRAHVHAVLASDKDLESAFKAGQQKRKSEPKIISAPVTSAVGEETEREGEKGERKKGHKKKNREDGDRPPNSKKIKL